MISYRPNVSTANISIPDHSNDVLTASAKSFPFACNSLWYNQCLVPNPPKISPSKVKQLQDYKDTIVSCFFYFFLNFLSSLCISLQMMDMMMFLHVKQRTLTALKSR